MPPSVTRAEELLAEHPPASTPAVAFLRAQYDAGLAWLHYPPGFGGLGASIEQQPLVDDLLAAAGAPPSGRITNRIGTGQCAATVLQCGSDEQKHHYLPALFTGEEPWCQLFSEPGSGSDLASLATRAALDGDEWVVDGQKVWTSGAHLARHALLLARTDPTAEKHAGLTAFAIDLHRPGVEVRPLRQMNGGAEFSEVFLSGARIPDAERLGDVGAGWAVAHQTLVLERYNMPRIPGRGEGPIADRAPRVGPTGGQDVTGSPRAQGPAPPALGRRRGAAAVAGTRHGATDGRRERTRGFAGQAVDVGDRSPPR